jgi:hypothetical protein
MADGRNCSFYPHKVNCSPGKTTPSRQNNEPRHYPHTAIRSGEIDRPLLLVVVDNVSFGNAKSESVDLQMQIIS